MAWKWNYEGQKKNLLKSTQKTTLSKNTALRFIEKGKHFQVPAQYIRAFKRP